MHLGLWYLSVYYLSVGHGLGSHIFIGSVEEILVVLMRMTLHGAQHNLLLDLVFCSSSQIS